MESAEHEDLFADLIRVRRSLRLQSITSRQRTDG
jgi:hypothetical protein